MFQKQQNSNKMSCSIGDNNPSDTKDNQCKKCKCITNKSDKKCDKDGCYCIETDGKPCVCVCLDKKDNIIRCNDCECKDSCKCKKDGCFCIPTDGASCICVCRDGKGGFKKCTDCNCIESCKDVKCKSNKCC